MQKAMKPPTDSYIVRTCDGIDYWSFDMRKAIHHAINLKHSDVNGLITVSIREFVIYTCVTVDHFNFLNQFNNVIPEKLGGYYMFAET